MASSEEKKRRAKERTKRLNREKQGRFPREENTFSSYYLRRESKSHAATCCKAENVPRFDGLAKTSSRSQGLCNACLRGFFIVARKPKLLFHSGEAPEEPNFLFLLETFHAHNVPRKFEACAVCCEQYFYLGQRNRKAEKFALTLNNSREREEEKVSSL